MTKSTRDMFYKYEDLDDRVSDLEWRTKNSIEKLADRIEALEEYLGVELDYKRPQPGKLYYKAKKTKRGAKK